MHIRAISISDRKGIRKKNIPVARLVQNFGIEDDAHAGKWHRQVSFLAQESIDSMRKKGLDVVAGNFAENLTTQGIDLTTLKVGDHLKIGDSEIIISQLGKICHTRCAIYHQAGDCVMPREGIFGVVTKDGTVSVGDKIHLLENRSKSSALVTSKEIHSQHGEKLVAHISKQFKTAVIRVDLLSNKEGGSIGEILKDLCETQLTSNIFILDPSGGIALQLPQILSTENTTTSFKQNQSDIYYCRSLEDFYKCNNPG